MLAARGVQIPTPGEKPKKPFYGKPKKGKQQQEKMQSENAESKLGELCSLTCR